MNLKYLTLVSVLGLAGLSTSCNVFDPFDSPTSDPQLLSAARACFDQGDFACALEHYGKMSGSQADVVASESAFLELDQAGASMGVLMKAVGNGGGGAEALNHMAGALGAGAGQTRRLQIFNAYLKTRTIQDPALRGLVRFVTGFALASAILGEQTAGAGTLKQLDLVSDVAGCKAASVLCVTDPTCIASSPVIIGGASLPAAATVAAADLTGTPTWGMVHFGLTEVVSALTTELSASGKFSSGLGGFTNELVTTASAFTNVDGCYRQTLLNLGVGEQ